MDAGKLVGELNITRQFFNKSTSVFDEADSGFAPVAGAFTVAQQIAHTAQTVDWFMDGAFLGKGFSMDFEAMEKEVRAVVSLAAARQWLERAFDNANAVIGGKSPAELLAPMPPGIMEGMPKGGCVSAIVDHTAHHRGALTVYARLLGKTSPMPYM